MVLASGIVLAFTLVNILGAKAVGNSEVIIVVIKIAVLGFFAAVGLYFADPGGVAPASYPASTSILFGAGVVFLAYEGFGLITNTAGDIRDPKKNLPRALYLSLIFTIAIYILVSVAVVGNLGVERVVEARDHALAAAAKPFLGSIGFTIVAVAALFSTASAINATLYGAARVSYITAKKEELPHFFELRLWKHNRSALFITTALVLLFAIFLDLEGVALLGSAAFLLNYSAVNIAHLRLIDETSAKRALVVAAIVGCLLSFVALTYYILTHTPWTILLLGLIVIFSFVAEYLYRN